MVYSALLHNCVCCVAGFDLPVYRDMYVRDWAVPNIMIAFPVTHEITAVFAQHITNFLFVLSH